MSEKKYIDELETRLHHMQGDLDDACDERDTLIAERASLESAIEDLNVQCKFWRQAAEHAVNGWNRLEDKVEAAHEALDAIEGNIDAARELLGSMDEWAPPDPAVEKLIDDVVHGVRTEVDLGDGVKLRVVEDETPLDQQDTHWKKT